MQKVVHEAPPDPRSRRPDLPEPLARIVLRLLNKEPEKRPDHDEGDGDGEDHDRDRVVHGSSLGGVAPSAPKRESI